MMRREADFFAEEDERRQAIATLSNAADDLMVSYNGTLEDNASLLDESTRQKLAALAETVKACAANEDVEVQDFQTAVDALQQGLLDIGRAVYGGADDQPSASTSSDSKAATPDSAPTPSAGAGGSGSDGDGKASNSGSEMDGDAAERERHSTQEILEGLEDLIDRPTVHGTAIADPAEMSATAKGVTPEDRPAAADPMGNLLDDLDLGMDLGEEEEMGYDSATVTADYEAIED